jgi:hypothetical protein
MRSLFHSALLVKKQCWNFWTIYGSIFKRLWSPGIDSKEWIPPAYVAWRASTITLFLLAPIDCLKIPAQAFFSQRRHGYIRRNIKLKIFNKRVGIRSRIRNHNYPVLVVLTLNLNMQHLFQICNKRRLTTAMDQIYRLLCSNREFLKTVVESPRRGRHHCHLLIKLPLWFTWYTCVRADTKYSRICFQFALFKFILQISC